MVADIGKGEPVSKGRVLLVEDDPLFQRLVQGILVGEGYASCCMATSGEEAIAMVAACNPDLVLMDINLEGDLNGIETAERILADVDVPVVFLSSYADKAILERIQRAGPYGFVAKPFRAEQLVAAVETALHRHHLDQHVQNSRDWFSTVLGSIADGVVSVDIEGIVTFVNTAGEALLGHSCMGKPLAEVLSLAIPGPAANIETIVNRAVEKRIGSAIDRLITMIGVDGVERSVHLTSRPLKDSMSEPIGAVLILRDVTEKERLLKELKGFKLAVDSMQIGVTMTDLDRKILYVNEAEAEMHGFEQGELLGRSARSLGTKGQEGSDDSWIERPARWTRQSVNARVDGTTFPVQLFSDVVRNSRGAPVGLVTCCEDLTERMRAENEIRKLNRAVEQSPVLVIITDMEGTIEYVNPQFCETTGYSSEEAIGQNPRILKGTETSQMVFDELWTTISQGGTWSGEFHNIKKDGSKYWAFATISGLRDDTGVISHYIGVQIDITRQKELLVQLEKQNTELDRLNRLKSDMVAITSHDLKSPLHAMISVANLLRDLGPDLDDDSKAGFIDQIITSGRKLSSFISDILDAEKIESDGISMVLAPTRLDELLEGCVATARLGGRDKGVEVRLTADGPFTPTLADAGRLEQVFNNLLSNAVKFAPEKSAIEVALEHEPGVLVITVADRGPGIPEGDIERIFDRYFQVASGGQVAERAFGVGLGLYITRQLVENHGGSVTAENRDGGGCLFVVRLPIADPEELGNLWIDPTADKPLEGRR